MPERVYVSLQEDSRMLVFDHAEGALDLRQALEVPGGPAPLALSPDHRWLYAGLRGQPGLATFVIGERGEIREAGRIPLEADPCQLSTDRSGRFLLAAYFKAGMITVHGIGADGLPLAEPIERRKTVYTAHMIITDAANRFALVPHRDADYLLQFHFDPRTGHLRPNDPDRMSLPARTGPRHYCYHPNGRWLFVSNELGGTVTACAFDAERGIASSIQTLSTLPDGFSGKNLCAEIRITPDGRFLYVSNRGHDSIAGFAVDPGTGAMKALAITPTEPSPRAFALDASGRFLLAAGQYSGRLASYRIEARSGALEPLSTCAIGIGAMWVLPVVLGGGA